MTGLFAYLAVVVAVAALCCGHHGEDFPVRLRGAWRYLRAPRRVFRDSRDAGASPGPPERRTAPHTPHWARTQPLEHQDAA